MTAILKANPRTEPACPKPVGYKVLVQLYIPPDKIGSVFTPEAYRREAKYSNIHGQVIALGSDAYTGEQFRESGPWCKADDWIIFERVKAFAFNYFGTPYALINDDCVGSVIEDPAKLELISLGDPSR